MKPCCRNCRHFLDDKELLECELAGITILGSAYGDTMGDQGLCAVHRVLTCPDLSCERFEPDGRAASAPTVGPRSAGA